MALAAAGLTLYPLLTAVAPNVEWILFVSFIGGVFTPGFGLAFFNGLLEVCPEENRASYIAGYSTLVNFAAFVSPMIASSLTIWFGLRELLLAGAMLRFGSAVWVWWSVYRHSG
jgi:MFS family permease